MSEEKTHKKWYQFLWNKYFIVGLAFVVWMTFFDQNSYLLHNELDKDLKRLREDKNYYEKEIDTESQELYNLEKNPGEYEKLAREKYLMKRENEDIFVIDKKDTLNHE